MKQKVKLHNFIFIYVMTTIVVTILSSARYVASFSTDAFTEIAIMANTVTTTMDTPISAYPGCDPIICPIVITNKDNDQICEVNQNYVIEVTRHTDVNIPLVIELYKDELCTEVVNKDENGMYVEDDFSFAANVEDTKTYYLKIEWPESENDSMLAFEIEAIAVNVIATQID